MRLQFKDVQGCIKEAASIFLLQRNERELLVAKRLCTLRRPSRKLMFERARGDIALAVSSQVAVFWVDNFNKVHFRNRPLHREGHVNGTAVAVVPALGALPGGWTGQSTLSVLAGRVADACAALRRLDADFAYELVGKIGLLQLDRIRVPCDVRRESVTAADWWPYDIQGHNISSSEGLVQVLAYLQRETAKLRLLLAPVLCDVNIFWRIQRMLYSQSYVHLDVHAGLGSMPIIFGVWHCYVHCIRRVWAVFRPWWMPIEYPELLGPDPGAAKCYDYPSLIQLEHTVLALAVHGPHLKAAIATARREVCASSASSSTSHDFVGNHRLMLLDMLDLFLTEYVPCLFQLGVEVRHCYWLGREKWSGAMVKPLLGKFIIFLAKLCWDTPAAFEYSRSALLAYLTWSTVHEQLPAAFHVEECLEASLSRLAAISSHAQHFDQEKDLAMLYCATCKASTEEKDVLKPGVSKKFVEEVANRLPELLAACKAGTLPFVPLKSPGHRSSAAPRWPSQPVSIPLRLTIADGALDFNALLLRALKLVGSPLSKTSKPEEVGYHLETTVCSALLPLGSQARLLRMLAFEVISKKLQAVQRPIPKAKPHPNPSAASSSAALLPLDVDPVLAEPDFVAPPRSPSVASHLSWQAPEEDLESVLTEDSRFVHSDPGDVDDYVVPYIDELEVDPLALI